MKHRCTFKKQFAALLNIIHNQRWAVVHPKRRRKPPLTKTSFLKLSSKPNSMSSSGNMTETAVEHSIKTKQLSYSMMLSKDPIKRCHKKTSRLL